MSTAAKIHERCAALKSSGVQCTAKAVSNGLCIGHLPGATEARKRGGKATSREARADRLLPTRLKPIAELLEVAFREVHAGTLDPKVGSAMAALSGALVRVIVSGELEERLRRLEEGSGPKFR